MYISTESETERERERERCIYFYLRHASTRYGLHVRFGEIHYHICQRGKIHHEVRCRENVVAVSSRVMPHQDNVCMLDLMECTIIHVDTKKFTKKYTIMTT